MRISELVQLNEWDASQTEELQQLGHLAERIAGGDEMAAAKFQDYIDNNFINMDSVQLTDKIRSMDSDQIYSLVRSIVRTGERNYSSEGM